eukprot:13389167-Alexandrium_andersonii.AAC.1
MLSRPANPTHEVAPTPRGEALWGGMLRPWSASEQGGSPECGLRTDRGLPSDKSTSRLPE